MSLLKRLFGQSAPRDQSLSYPAYIQRYADLVRHRHPSAHVEIHLGENATQSHVAWIMPNGTQARQYFGNWYARYLGGADEIDVLLAGQLDEAYAMDNLGAATDRSRIFPVIKPATWTETVHRQLGGTDREAATAGLIERPFIGDLIVTYVIDTSDNMQFVTRPALETMGIDEAALQDAAIDNLATMLSALQIEGGDGRYAARLDRNYDASMLLILAQWREKLPLEGPVCIAVPARDEVLLCAADDMDSREMLAEIAKEIATQAAYPLSSQLLRWTEDGFSIVDAR